MAFVQFFTGDVTTRTEDPVFGGVNEFVQGDDFDEDSEPGNRRDLHSIRILEATSFDGDYQEIDVVKIQPTKKFITTRQASQSFLLRWYKLEFINDPALPEEKRRRYGLSEPVVPEVLATIVDDVREWLGDTDVDNPAWPDKNYIHTIRFAIKQHRGDRNHQFVDEADIVPIQTLVRQEFAQVIAYDHAKYYQLQAPAAQLDKSQIMSHYLEVAGALDAHYNQIARRLNLESGGYDESGVINQMPSPNVVDVARYSRSSGQRVLNIKPSTFRRRNFFSTPLG